MEQLSEQTIKACFGHCREALANLKAFHEAEVEKSRERAAGDLLKYGHECSANAYKTALESLQILANSLGVDL